MGAVAVRRIDQYLAPERSGLTIMVEHLAKAKRRAQFASFQIATDGRGQSQCHQDGIQEGQSAEADSSSSAYDIGCVFRARCADGCHQ